MKVLLPVPLNFLFTSSTKAAKNMALVLLFVSIPKSIRVMRSQDVPDESPSAGAPQFLVHFFNKSCKKHGAGAPVCVNSHVQSLRVQSPS
jgi:hypothetical protein